MKNNKAFRGSGILVLGIALGAPTLAWARADGFLTQAPANCSGCHTDRDSRPEITVKFSKEELALGETVTVDIAIKATSFEPHRAGVRMNSGSNGKFELVDTDATRLYSPTQAVHARPMPLRDKEAKFQFKWVAPDKAGVTNFVVDGVTSIPPPSGTLPSLYEAKYSSNSISVSIAHGCDGVWYYPDNDKDGFGDKKLGTLSCEPLKDMITKGEDCDDAQDKTYPGATEICDSADNDCDGTPDDGLDPGLYYRDADGDGFATSRSTSPIAACNDKQGYAKKRGDCDDSKSGINPGAKEKCDDVDNDCDGKVDELEEGQTCADLEEEEEEEEEEGEGEGEDGGEDAGSNGGGCSVGTGWSVGPLPITLALVFGAMVAGRLTRRRRR